MDQDVAEAAGEVRRAYVAWIEALAAQAPVVLAIEDLHWAHASTRELAEDLLALTDRAPLLLVATLRRDTASEGWRFRTRVLTDFSHRATEIALDPLPPAAASEILATLLPGVVDEATGEGIVARAEGNPLYLEELLRALLEAGGLERQHRTWTTTLKPSLLLPPALENLLVARIDRLAEGPRRLAQIAAVLGREFPVRVLSTSREKAAATISGSSYAPRSCASCGATPSSCARSGTGSSRRRRCRRSRPGGVESSTVRWRRPSRSSMRASLDDHLERLAHYHAQSGNITQAIAYLERAAARADELGAGSRAAELRERSRELALEIRDVRPVTGYFLQAAAMSKP